MSINVQVLNDRWDDLFSCLIPCLFGDTGIEPVDLDLWSEKNPTAPFYHWIPESNGKKVQWDFPLIKRKVAQEQEEEEVVSGNPMGVKIDRVSRFRVPTRVIPLKGGTPGPWVPPFPFLFLFTLLNPFLVADLRNHKNFWQKNFVGPQADLRNHKNFWQISGQTSSFHSQYKICFQNTYFPSDICYRKAHVLKCESTWNGFSKMVNKTTWKN
jgi:hypothetical protein